VTIAAPLLVFAAARAEGQYGCLKVETIKTSHRTLQPGGTLKVQVRLKTSHCVLENASAAGTSTVLLVEPRPGFESTTGSIVYSDFEKQLSSLDAPQAHALETTIEVKIGQVQPGAYLIPVFVTYQAADEQGNVSIESSHFTIPVEVKMPWDLRKILITTGEVFVVVLLWPVWILKCTIVGGCSGC
jgi:hypothetical protein